MYSSKGYLEIDAPLAFNFLKELQNGELGRSGYEPTLKSVLVGEASFTPSKPSCRFSVSNGELYLNALTELHAIHYNLLNNGRDKSSNYTALRDEPLIKSWTSNMTLKEIKHREE